MVKRVNIKLYDTDTGEIITIYNNKQVFVRHDGFLLFSQVCKKFFSILASGRNVGFCVDIYDPDLCPVNKDGLVVNKKVTEFDLF